MWCKMHDTEAKSRAEVPGAYNSFWLDPGSTYTISDGEQSCVSLR